MEKNVITLEEFGLTYDVMAPYFKSSSRIEKDGKRTPHMDISSVFPDEMLGNIVLKNNTIYIETRESVSEFSYAPEFYVKILKLTWDAFLNKNVPCAFSTPDRVVDYAAVDDDYGDDISPFTYMISMIRSRKSDEPFTITFGEWIPFSETLLKFHPEPYNMVLKIIKNSGLEYMKEVGFLIFYIENGGDIGAYSEKKDSLKGLKTFLKKITGTSGVNIADPSWIKRASSWYKVFAGDFDCESGNEFIEKFIARNKPYADMASAEEKERIKETENRVRKEVRNSLITGIAGAFSDNRTDEQKERDRKRQEELENLAVWLAINEDDD